MTPKPLPNSLKFHMLHDENVPLMRRRMAKLCGNNQARIIYGVQDQSQPIGHVAVLMCGRAIFGWLIRLHSGHKWGCKVGDIVSTEMNLVLFSGAFRAHVEAKNLGYLHRTADENHNALVTRYTRHDEDGGELTETLWNEDLCRDLVRAVGMVEIFDLDRSQLAFASQGVIIPNLEDDGWILWGRRRAEEAARREVQPVAAWWNLPSDIRTINFLEPEIAPSPSHHDCRGWLSVRVWHLRTTPGIIEPKEKWASFALPRAFKIEFTAKAYDQLVEVEAKRSYKDQDLNWYISIKRVADNRIHDCASYPGLLDAQKVLDMLLDAFRRSVPLPRPEKIVSTSEEIAIARQEWHQHVSTTQEAHRKLQFVMDAILADQAA